MEIVGDEPGRRLVLEETAGRMPLSILAAGVALVAGLALPWRGLWAVLLHGAGWDSVDLATSGVWLVLGLLFLGSLRGGSRLERLEADRDAGRVQWTSTHLGGLVTWRSRVGLDVLAGVSIALVPATRPAPTGPSKSRARRGLRLHLGLARQGRSDRRLALHVQGVENTEHVADLALRLGAAAGLSFYRVVRNEGPLFEIEVRATGGPGLRAVTLSAAAGASADKNLPPFDPATFDGSARVTPWAPGERVAFTKGWGASVVLAPLVLAAALGPLAYLRLASLRAMPFLPRAAALALITLSGLGLAVVGAVGLTTGLPRRVRLDWGERALRIEGRGGKVVPFADIVALELRGRSHWTTSRQHTNRTLWRWTEVRALLRPSPAVPSADALLVETRWYREDAASPRADALPLATELAAALGVPLREAEIP